jgi:TonB family protein
MFIEGQNSGYDSLWYPTGELKEAGTFEKGQQVGVVQGWYRNGARSYVGAYFHDLKDSVWTSWYSDGTVSERTLYDRGRIVDGKQWSANGRLEGVYGIDSVDRLPMWTWYDSQGNVFAVEVYQGTKIVRGRYINEDGTEHDDPRLAWTEPQFHGDGGSMLNYMQRATRYPERARRAGAEGTIVVLAAITEQGSIEEIQITEGGDPSLEAEALRVVRTMKQWKPGRQYNRPAKLYIQLPFVFKLN